MPICKTCGGNQPLNFSTIKAVCRVCELLHNDKGEHFVEYCELCKAYICQHHWNDWVSRGLAALKELVKKDE